MSKKIAKNTIYLYFRMMVVMIVNLITVRIVLRALGADDYGLYQVVAGIVISIQSFSSVMATSTQRFYSFSIGRKKHNKLSQLFSSSLNIYIWISIICFILAETVGLWFVNTQLVIPPERIGAANWIYQFSIVSLICTLLVSPFLSAVIAYEDMGFFAVLSLCETFIKLLAVIAISYSSSDRLILYGLALLIVPFISLTAYALKTFHCYPHIRYCKVTDHGIYKQMLSFSGWHLFSTGASVGINQINTILINLFFPLVVNAARGISLQVMGAFSSFCSSFIMAVRPPLIKAYAEKDYSYLNRLFNYSNKFIYYLTLVVALPLLFEMGPILELWLGETSVEMVLFSQLIVIYSMVLCLNNPLSIIAQATGKIKQYFLPVESVTLVCPIATYVLFKMGCPSQATYYVMIVTISLAHVIRVVSVKKIYPQLELSKYIKGFLIPAMIITAGLSALLFILKQFAGVSLIPFIILAVCAILIISYLFGLDKTEKMMAMDLMRKALKKSGKSN